MHRDEFEQTVLRYISRVEGFTSRQLCAALKETYTTVLLSFTGSASKPGYHIAKLKRQALVAEVNGKIILTDKGKNRLDSRINIAKSNTVDRVAGQYLCPELGRTVTRPGAYDFLNHPSLVGTVRVPYKHR